MGDPKYFPTTRTGRYFHLIEELGEVAEASGRLLAALGKAGRHGMDSYNPELPPGQRETNAQWILREMEQLETAIAKAKTDVIMEISFQRSPE